MKFSEQLKQYRKSRGLSQEALARKVFCSFKTISNYENESPKPASEQAQNRIRAILKDFPDGDYQN